MAAEKAQGKFPTSAALDLRAPSTQSAVSTQGKAFGNPHLCRAFSEVSLFNSSQPCQVILPGNL